MTRRAPGLAGLFTAAAVLAALAGCATPRYQAVTRYEPPADPAGRACLEGCEQALTECRGHCAARYQACLKQVEPQAEAHYVEVLEGYAAELSRYRDALDRYRYDVWLGWGHDPWWVGHGWHGPWYGPGYYPWPPPRVPERAEVLARYSQRACGGDCGCQSVYDACFLGCGGTRTVESRCVANCPARPAE
jgi:hypothetical protein